jgi:HEPN domain-containing protein
MSSLRPPYRSWLTKAEHDLVALQRIMAEPGAPWDTVCFHAQQSAEKVLKAFLVFRGQAPSKTPNLDRLLTDCVTFDPSLARVRKDCIRLTTYGVEARYPDVLFEPTKRQATAAVAAMHRIRAAIFALLPQ